MTDDVTEAHILIVQLGLLLIAGVVAAIVFAIISIVRAQRGR